MRVYIERDAGYTVYTVYGYDRFTVYFSGAANNKRTYTETPLPSTEPAKCSAGQAVPSFHHFIASSSTIDTSISYSV